MTEDERRKDAIYNFYAVYEELKQYDNLRAHTHTTLGEDTVITVDRYYSGGKSERVLKVTQEDEVTAYEQAADQIKRILGQIKQNISVERRGA